MNTSNKQMKRIVAVGALLAASMVQGVAHEQEPGVEVKPVRAEKLPNVPGKTLTAVTVDYAPGAKSSAHQHAGSVFAYVLSGAIKSEKLGDRTCQGLQGW
ncbi:hypothetical protein [Pedosphaera parvula]|uniref:Cupin 2 conserved barrel domain protein n=1 Tax=Pedosphaera parvula (strain Ellin514) TaxID=320771 RepID=B9XK94_PEDPL|nr:hypothetical protein Cflav_PD2553 [Pedosphaera parvula Ellin514]